MTKGGTIIRLIDVALILLLGFIAISDIRIRAQLKLPSPSGESDAKQVRRLVFVIINPQGRFSLRYSGYSETNINGIDALEKRLLQIRDKFSKENAEMVVLIEPNQNTIVQHTVDVLDLCEKHKILKNINYQSLEL